MVQGAWGRAWCALGARTSPKPAPEEVERRCHASKEHRERAALLCGLFSSAWSKLPRSSSRPTAEGADTPDSSSEPVHLCSSSACPAQSSADLGLEVSADLAKMCTMGPSSAVSKFELNLDFIIDATGTRDTLELDRERRLGTYGLERR